MFFQVYRYFLNKGVDETSKLKEKQKIISYWSHFATRGSPYEDERKWPKYESPRWTYLGISGRSQAILKKRRERECKFWEDILPQLNGESFPQQEDKAIGRSDWLQESSCRRLQDKEKKKMYFSGYRPVVRL